MPRPTRPASIRPYLRLLACVVASLWVAPALIAAEHPSAAKATGPIVGHVDAGQAYVWYRPTTPGPLTLSVRDPRTGSERRLSQLARTENDLCVTWHVTGLLPQSRYQYAIFRGDKQLAGGPSYYFETAPDEDAAARVSLAFGSCASSTDFFDIWRRIRDEGAEGVVLLGDTPYIDTADLAVNRNRHREFLQIPTLAEMCRSTPLWSTWDDHDFGANDSDGRIANKATIRNVFRQYRAQHNYGDGSEGIYTRFRRGPVEVFLLDPRWFSQTAPSPVAPDQVTCLGSAQWKWLLEGLESSTATFKVLATGMIWDDKKSSEKDDWETYRHEREALFDFIGEKKIAGVVLVGGDIHCSRALRFRTEPRIGYPLWQFVTSPLHDGVIPSLNVPHPDLIYGEPVPNTFLRLTADSTRHPPTLVATWIQMSGRKLHEVRLDAQELTPAVVPGEVGFRTIFDGRTLAGWEGSDKWFRIEDGAIVGGSLSERIPHNEFLCTEREYDDFELRLQVKAVGEGLNAGIQIRSRRIPHHHEMIGYQADVGEGWWGKLYDESRRATVLAGPKDESAEPVIKENDWNDYVIRCEGRRVQIWINGRQTVDYFEPDESLEQKGLIGLQIHGGPPTEAWYRHVRIRELK